VWSIDDPVPPDPVPELSLFHLAVAVVVCTGLKVTEVYVAAALDDRVASPDTTVLLFVVVVSQDCVPDSKVYNDPPMVISSSCMSPV
jgi:hypothetical protein